ncbi:protein IQ-DOMAIN 3-like [Phragmites australis]|uniref:protein IQ-DOMAIN 3-like n=1 Tax=Phragmites australis TaxID=29695 RepID=UPI002D7674B1|nr:protein IQ-DOMAIN 3-like [Phragmites australis]
MGRKGRWFDTVQRILSASEPDPEEKEAKVEPVKSRDKSNFKKIWQFGKSNQSVASTSAAPAPAPVPEAHQQPSPAVPPSPSDRQQTEGIIAEVQPVETMCGQGYLVCPAEVALSGAGAAQAAAEAIARPTVTTPRTRPARSKEDIAATRIQAACRGYLARRANRARGMVRLMSLVEGLAVRRQTEEALYCMQTMTRVQTQIYSRRVKTEEDKKALKSQIKGKQSFDKTKIGEGWDHSHQSKEQMEAVLTMKQEAASRRQRALAYAFSHQWRNRNPSSARAAPPPMFTDPGNPNWGWTWTDRWMAAARPWERQTAPDNGRAPAKSAGRQPRVATSVQLPTTPSGRSFRPPSWPSLTSPSTPPPRSPSVSGRTVVLASPRSSPLHATSGLQRTKSMQSDRRPRSSQERPVSSPRPAVPASPRGSGSPIHAAFGQQRATSMQPERRSRSSQERAVSNPRHGGTNATLRRTTSLRSEPPRRLSLGGAVAASAGDNASAPATPSYMQPTKSVRAKARCPSPSASAAEDKLDVPERTLTPLQVPSPSSAKKRLSLAFADKRSASSPSTTKAERAKRHSQPPSPRT